RPPARPERGGSGADRLDARVLEHRAEEAADLLLVGVEDGEADAADVAGADQPAAASAPVGDRGLGRAERAQEAAGVVGHARRAPDARAPVALGLAGAQPSDQRARPGLADRAHAAGREEGGAEVAAGQGDGAGVRAGRRAPGPDRAWDRAPGPDRA